MSENNRLRSYALVLVFVLLLNFWLPRLLPGGPIESIAGGGDEGAVFLTEAQKAAMQEYYHLNDSLGVQFVKYVQGIFTLDFGRSILFKSPVYDVILERLPWTLLLVGLATVFSIVIGLAVGLYSAWRHPGRSDRALFLGMLGLSAVPEFLLGMLLLLFFSVNLKWFPLSGAKTAFLRADHWLDQAIDIAAHAALPALTLTAASLSGMYLLMRNESIRVKAEPYIEFAAAKGIGSARLAMRHIARNAALPLVTMIVIRLGGLLAGSVLAETVFAYPGIGKLLQEAILGRDYPLLHGLFFGMTLFVLLLHFAADLVYPRLDPRIRRAVHRGEPA